MDEKIWPKRFGKFGIELLTGRRHDVALPYDKQGHEGITNHTALKILNDMIETRKIYRDIAAENNQRESQLFADCHDYGKNLNDELFEEGDLVLMRDMSVAPNDEITKFKKFL